MDLYWAPATDQAQDPQWWVWVSNTEPTKFSLKKKEIHISPKDHSYA